MEITDKLKEATERLCHSCQSWTNKSTIISCPGFHVQRQTWKGEYHCEFRLQPLTSDGSDCPYFAKKEAI